MKTYLIIGSRFISSSGAPDGTVAFIAAAAFNEKKPIEPQLLAYAKSHSIHLALDRGLVVCEAVAAIGGPRGRGPE